MMNVFIFRSLLLRHLQASYSRRSLHYKKLTKMILILSEDLDRDLGAKFE